MCAAVQLSEGQATRIARVRLNYVPLLTRSRKQILSAIATRPGVTMSDIARRYDRHVAWADYHLHFLRQAGFVVRRRARGHKYNLYLNGDAP